MAIKYVPNYPDTVAGQAILNNITRAKRKLRYRDNNRVYERIRRGMPYYELELLEQVRTKETNGLFDKDGNKTANGFTDMLIRGEAISACAYLEEKGIKVDLVYIDPPFASGADYARKVYIRRNPIIAETIARAEQEMDIEELRSFEEKMYGDIWNKEDYLNWMYENLTAIKSIMSETASIYVHLDWHIGHYVKILLDEVFGEDNFRNEIIWAYRRWTAKSNTFQNSHDIIYWFSKNEDFIWSQQYESYADNGSHFTGQDEKGDYRWQYLNGEKYKLYKGEGTRMKDWWDDIPYINSMAEERIDYATQKPEALIERIIKASSNEGMTVADFFGGSGVTAKVAHDLKRKFIHCDVGINSIQTTRDRLMAAGANFDIYDIKDGVSLFRNPVQTMDKLKTLVTGLKNEDALDSFWEGAIDDSKSGMMPVYIPNLIDHSAKVLDKPMMNRIINEAIPCLPEEVTQVIVYYVDIDDRAEVERFIAEYNETLVKIELRDLKHLLDDIFINDEVDYEIKQAPSHYEIEFKSFSSDRLIQKIDAYNQKKSLQDANNKNLFAQNGSENGNNGDEENGSGGDIGNGNGEVNGGARKKPFTPIEISATGLELIELISLDCTAAAGPWKSDTELKIDKNGFVIQDGEKTKQYWNAKIISKKKPLRMKVRNIAGDESIFKIEWGDA